MNTLSNIYTLGRKIETYFDFTSVAFEIYEDILVIVMSNDGDTVMEMSEYEKMSEADLEKLLESGSDMHTMEIPMEDLETLTDDMLISRIHMFLEQGNSDIH